MKTGKGNCFWCGTLTMFATNEGKNMHFTCVKCYYWRIPWAVFSAIVVGLWRKIRGMKLIIFLLCVILLAGCDAPVTVAERRDQLLHDYNTLLAERDNLLTENERLENASANLTDLRSEHNKLINDYHALQMEYAILMAYNETQRIQNENLLEAFALQFVDKGDAITYLYKENINLIEKHKELNTQIAAVHSENVTILSANLTDTEYSAFYKGWKLWWGEFNDE